MAEAHHSGYNPNFTEVTRPEISTLTGTHLLDEACNLCHQLRLGGQLLQLFHFLIGEELSIQDPSRDIGWFPLCLLVLLRHGIYELLLEGKEGLNGCWDLSLVDEDPSIVTLHRKHED